MLALEKHEDVYVLRMNGGENRFSLPWFAEFNRLLDEVEKSTGPAALVTIGEGKFYSNGIDLDWLSSQSTDVSTFVFDLHRFFARILAFPVATVAALNGHAFAGGALFALVHDFRVMRTDRGYFCLPEIDVSIPFTTPLAEIVRMRLPPQVAHTAMITGKRYAAEEARSSGIVDQIAAEADVLPRALELAQSLAAKDRATMRAIKQNAYSRVLELLRA